MDNKDILTPAEIGEYLSLDQCSRFFKHRINGVDKSEHHDSDEYDEAFTPLNLLLAEAGEQFEQGVKRQYEQYADDVVDLTSDDDSDTFDPDTGTVCATIKSYIDAPVETGFTVLFQPTLTGEMAAYDIAGHADFVLIWATESGAGVRVIDAKSTADEKSYHQIQAAIYTRLIEQAVTASAEIDSDRVNYSAGVVTRDTEWPTPFDLESHPSFDYQSRITDITRMLQEDGDIDTTSDLTLGEARHALTGKCGQCPFSESCATEAFEASHIRLLGLTESEQEALAGYEVTTIEELADLCTVPNDNEWEPTTQKRAGWVRKDDKYYDLKADPTIGDRLPNLVYRAEAVRQQLSDPDDYQNGLWIPGTGKCQLPEDNPFDPEGDDVKFAPNSMIRVYLNIQEDHLRDRVVQLSARVSVSDPDIDSIRISELSDDSSQSDELTNEQIGFNPTAADNDERQLLASFAANLNLAIETVARKLDVDDAHIDSEQDHPLLQFYTYTADEYHALREAIDRVTDADSDGREGGDTEDGTDGSGANSGRSDSGTTGKSRAIPTESQNTDLTARQGVESPEQLIQAFDETLEGEPGVDTPRVAHIKPELESRLAIPAPSYGLLHVYDCVNTPTDDYSKSKSPEEWAHTPESTEIDETVDIRSLFRHRLFNTERAWSRTDEGISVDPTTYPDGNSGVKTRHRDGAEIPLGYLWAAMGRIDERWIETVEMDIDDDASYIKNDINSYLYHNSARRTNQISEDDVTALGKHFVDAIEHVERAAFYRNEKITNRKPEVDPATLWTDSRETETIAEAARDYLAFEHTAQKQERYELYRKLPRQRILSGESIPVKITSIDTDTESNINVVVEGELEYDDRYLFGENARDAILACKRKGKEGTSGGDRMVAKHLNTSSYKGEMDTPSKIEMGVKATIRSIDLKAETITFELRNMYGKPSRYDRKHRRFTLDNDEATGDDFKMYVARGMSLILDPTTENFPADRADKALETADQNAVHDLLESLRWGQADALSDTMFDADHLEAFAEWMNANIGPETYPNDAQQRFITASDQVGLLQGPPGTGKTDGTLAPTLCARLFAAGQTGQSVSGLITAPSNTAVDEVLESTAELLNTLSEQGVHGLSQETVDIVRVTYNPPENPIDGVEYLHYSDSDGAKRLRELRDQMQAADSRVIPSSQTNQTPTADGGQTQSGQATIGVFDADESTTTDVTGDGPPASEQSHTLIFATPTSSWGIFKKINTTSSPDPAEIASFDLWDLVVADEASMLTLPKLILSGVGMKRSGQLLLGGDHRQLPPVNKHDWEETHRKSIVEAAPQLSALNYFRLLGGDLDSDHEDDADSDEGSRMAEHGSDENKAEDVPRTADGDDTDVLDAKQREQLAADIDPERNPIPLVQLDTTFRFGTETADFLGDVVYNKDGIDYSANGHDDIPQLDTARSEPLQTAYAPNPITVITYNSDRTFQQVNPIEAVICNSLLLRHTHEATAGVVTPHNAHRSRIRSNVSTMEKKMDNPPVDLDNGTQVETVNRFQGGQKDIMIVSATASNPQFIRSESDFLLELNRANVAFSRHKYKLIVVMAESLLSHIPKEPDTYDESLLWKTLAYKVGEPPTVDHDPDWSGTLKDFAPVPTPDEQLAEATDLSIYQF